MDLRDQAPTDLTLSTRGAREPEHEFTDDPAGRVLHRRDDERVPVRLDVRLPDALFDLRACLIEVHRFPGEVSAYVLPTEHVVQGREVVHLIRS